MCAPQHHGTPGRGPTHPGLDDTDREGGCNCGINRITPCIEHGSTDFRCASMLGCDNATFCGDYGFMNGLGTREIFCHGKALLVLKCFS
jgi:hypothetical protein